jgi:hypothetical protein
MAASGARVYRLLRSGSFPRARVLGAGSCPSHAHTFLDRVKYRAQELKRKKGRRVGRGNRENDSYPWMSNERYRFNIYT